MLTAIIRRGWPASCSRRIEMICSSENLLLRIVRLPSRGSRTLPKSEGNGRSHVTQPMEAEEVGSNILHLRPIDFTNASSKGPAPGHSTYISDCSLPGRPQCFRTFIRTSWPQTRLASRLNSTPCDGRTGTSEHGTRVWWHLAEAAVPRVLALRENSAQFVLFLYRLKQASPFRRTLLLIARLALCRRRLPCRPRGPDRFQGLSSAPCSASTSRLRSESHPRCVPPRKISPFAAKSRRPNRKIAFVNLSARSEGGN